MDNRNFIKFWEIFSKSNLYKRLRYKAQIELNFNVIFTEFISNLNDAKSTLYSSPEIAGVQKSLDVFFLTSDITELEKNELDSIINESGLSSVIWTRDNDYISSHIYNYQNNTIIPPQPYPSWSLDENDVWQPPIPCPGSSFPTWDEAAYQADNTTGWVVETQINN